MNPPLVSVVILDFLKAPKVIENVKSVLTQVGSFDLEVLVGDNSNNTQNAKTLQEGLENFTNVDLTIFDKNHGYTKGNNLLASKAKGDFIAIVNPDIEWKDPGTLANLLKSLQSDDSIGVIAPRQEDPDGTSAMTVRGWPNLLVQVGRRTFLRNLPGMKSLVLADEKSNFDYSKTQEVEWVQSSFLVMPKPLWDSLGGLDEDYFLFMGDTELCWQVWKNQKRVIFDATTTVYADGIRLSGGGFRDFFGKWVIRQHLKDSFLYTQKHFREKKPF